MSPLFVLCELLRSKLFQVLKIWLCLQTLVSFGLFLREFQPQNSLGVQETQLELDTFPRLPVSLSVLPRFQFSIHLITQTQLLPDVVGRYCGLTVH